MTKKINDIKTQESTQIFSKFSRSGKLFEITNDRYLMKIMHLNSEDLIIYNWFWTINDRSLSLGNCDSLITSGEV